MAWSVKKRMLVSCTIGWGLTILGAVMIPVMEWIVKRKIENTVIIKEDSPVYEYWQDPPVPIYLKVYMFNVSNPAEFLNGEKPALVQTGPYTYSEKRVKYNIIWNDNGTVTYRQNRTFHFIPEMSSGTESDMFMTVNPVYWALFNALRYEDPRVREAVVFLADLFNEHVLLTRTLKEIIWGYHDPMLNVTKLIDPDWFYTDYIGYFMNKNETNDGVYTVYTGAKNISELGIIDMYNGSRFLNFWSTEWANMINGTDGTLGPPYLPRDMLMHSFASDICRSIAGVFSKEVYTSQGIKLWRFAAPSGYLDNATVYPDNAGFCTPKGNCLDSGVFNITACQSVDFFHLPAALSYPHFLDAAQRYQDAVVGLNPDPNLHEPVIDLEPYTGLVMQAYKRLQLNMYVEPIANISETLNITPVFLPVFWLEESAVIDDKSADKFFSLLFTPLKIIHAAEITIISCGALILLSTTLYGVLKYRQVNREIQEIVKEEDNTNADYDTPPEEDDTRPMLNDTGQNNYGTVDCSNGGVNRADDSDSS